MFCKVSYYWLESTQHFHPFGDISSQLGQVRLTKVMPTANKSCQDVPVWVHSTKEHPPQCPGPLYLDHDHHYNILQGPLAWNMKIWVWRMTHKITVGLSSLNLIFFFFFFFSFDIDWSCTGSNEIKFPIKLNLLFLCNAISKKQTNYTNSVLSVVTCH